VRDALALVWKAAIIVVGFFWLLDAFARYAPMVATKPAYDFVIDQRLARGFVEGFNPYTPAGAHRAELDQWLTGLGHPPTTPFWAIPFVPLETHVANTAVAWFTICLLLLQIVKLADEQQWWAPWAHAWLVFAAIVNTDFFLMHIGLGQFSVAIGFCYFLAWFLSRRGQDVSAGIPLGIACTIKVFPAFVVFYFLLTRRFRTVITAVVVYLSVATVMTFRYGWSSWRYFSERQPKIMDEWLGRIQNQSLFGITEHLFHPTCLPRQPVSHAGLWLGVALLLLVVAGVSLLALRALRRDPRSDVPLATFVALSVFCSQWTWEHYDVILLLPLAIAAHHFVRRWREDARSWRRVLVSAAGLLVLFGFVSLLRMSIGFKDTYQNRVWRGDASVHGLLHLFEILNWLPLAGLLAMLAGILWTLGRQASGRTSLDPRTDASS
jgi:hypothetical protein